jgi:uncharacterized membrane protein
MEGESIVQAVAGVTLPPELIVAALGFLPIVEMRGAVPVAQGLYGFGWVASFFWAFLGSMLPAPIILKLADPVIAWCNRKSPLCARLAGRAIERTRKHFAKDHRRFGEIALLIFVALPLPGTGVWGGSLAAVLFGVPFVRAMWLIGVGNAVAGLLISLASAGVITFVKFIV